MACSGEHALTGRRGPPPPVAIHPCRTSLMGVALPCLNMAFAHSSVALDWSSLPSWLNSPAQGCVPLSSPGRRRLQAMAADMLGHSI